MASYDLGSTVRLTVTFKVGATPTDPTTIALQVGNAAGSPTTYTYALSQITRTSAGVYWKEIVPATAGRWVAIWTGAGDVDAVEVQEFDVVESSPWADAAAAPIYATLSEFKAMIGFGANAPSSLDVNAKDIEFRQLLQDASRQIDDDTNRRFYVGDDEEERTFTWEQTGSLAIPDLVSAASITFDLDGDRTYETTLSATDYRLRRDPTFPYDGPYTRLELDPVNGRYGWPTVADGVKIVGAWGFCTSGTVPAPIRRACLLWANRLHNRKAAALGVLENSAGGPPIRVGSDADYVQAIERYRKRWYVA